MQWNRVDVVDPDEPMFAGLGERPWFYFVHSLHGVPDDAAQVAATCDYGGHGQRRLPRRQRVRHAVPPGEVGGRRPRPPGQLRRRPVRPPVTLLYPSIDLRGGHVVRLRQGDYAAETVYDGDAVDVAARLLRRRGHVDPRRRPRRGAHGRARQPAGGRRRRRRRRRAGQRAGGRRRPLRRRRRGAARRRRGPRRDGLGRRRPARPSSPTSPPCSRWPSGSTTATACSPCTAGPSRATSRWPTRCDRFPAAAAFVITDIARDGLLGGPDVDGLAAAVAATSVPVIASGGVGSLDDVARPRRRSPACTASSPGGRCTSGGSPSPRPWRCWPVIV